VLPLPECGMRNAECGMLEFAVTAKGKGKNHFCLDAVATP